MANRLYESIMQNQQRSNPLSNMSNFMTRLQQLKQSGVDPNQQIQQMMASGQITQEQYNQAVTKAQKIQQLTKIFG